MKTVHAPSRTFVHAGQDNHFAENNSLHTFDQILVYISPSYLPHFAARVYTRGRELATSILTFQSPWSFPLESGWIQRSVLHRPILRYVAYMH